MAPPGLGLRAPRPPPWPPPLLPKGPPEPAPPSLSDVEPPPPPAMIKRSARPKLPLRTSDMPPPGPEFGFLYWEWEVPPPLNPPGTSPKVSPPELLRPPTFNWKVCPGVTFNVARTSPPAPPEWWKPFPWAPQTSKTALTALPGTWTKSVPDPYVQVNVFPDNEGVPLLHAG